MWEPKDAIPTGLQERLQRLAERKEKVSPEAWLAAFLELANALKREERTGWVDRAVPQPESVGDHMYRMALMAMMSTNQNLNMAQCIQIALVHDLAEALVGDIPPYAGVSKSEKHRREEAAMAFLRELLSNYNKEAASRLYDLWTQYEDQTTPEAAFVKDLDKLELLHQADEYQRMHPNIPLDDFAGVEKGVKTPEGLKWAQGLHEWSGTTGVFREQTSGDQE